MDGRDPLPTLLSQGLVAFTVELDNEFEHRLPHRTADHGRTPGAPSDAPWLTSAAMWSTCLRFVGEAGVRVGGLGGLSRTRTNLAGLQRWGYITLGPDPADSRPKPPEKDLVIHATAAGRRAQELWRTLFGLVEERWRGRFGAERIDRLREALIAVIGRFDTDVPDCLPILGYGLWTRDGIIGAARGSATGDVDSPGAGRPDALLPDALLADASLHALLSRVLLAFALVFERATKSDMPLAIGANVLRVLDEDGTRLRDLPRLGGVSKEGISMALGVLDKQGIAVVESDPDGGRWKTVRLTGLGVHARDAYLDRLGLIEKRWSERLGADAVETLRRALKDVVGDPNAPLSSSPLAQGLEPYDDGWRAQVARPAVLPHFPMMLHRGGYPDGS